MYFFYKSVDLQTCNLKLQVHNSKDSPYFYGLSVKLSDLLDLINSPNYVRIIEKLPVIHPGCKAP